MKRRITIILFVVFLPLANFSYAGQLLSKRVLQLQDLVDEQHNYENIVLLIEQLLVERETVLAAQYLTLLDDYVQTSAQRGKYWLLAGKKQLLDDDVCQAEQYLELLKQSEFSDYFASLLASYMVYQQTHTLVAEQIECLLNNTRSVMRQRGLVRSSSLYFYIHFDTDSANLTATGQTQLQSLAESLVKLQPVDYQVFIVGHADERGTDEYNMNLSKRRADTIKRNIVLSYPLLEDLIVSQGRGEKQPLIKDSNLEAYALNRRVELYLSKQESKHDQ